MEIVALETLNELTSIDKENEYEIFVKKDTGNQCLINRPHVQINQTIRLPFPFWEQLYLPFLVRKKKVDLLHCSSNTAPIFTGKPIVVTIHDIIYMDRAGMTGGSAYQNFGNLYRRLLVPLVVKKAAIIITVSEFARQQLIHKFDMNPEKVRVIHNGIHNKFHVINNENPVTDFRKKFELPNQFLLHFANEAPRKNTLGTLKAYADYSQNINDALPLVLTNTNKEIIIELIKKNNLSDISAHIICLNYIAAEELPLLYNAAYIFLYPSLSEGFGMPLIESMACGTPVITGNNSSLPEIAGDAALLVNAATPGEIANAIHTLSGDNDLYKKLQAAGLKNAARFSWKNAAIKTLKIYNEVMGIRN